MSQFQRIHEAWSNFWRRFSELRRRLPLWTQISAGFLVLLLLLAGSYSIFFARASVLHLRVQHSFRSGQIAVFVDDDSVFTGKLAGSVKKKYGLFGDTVQGSLTQEIPVSSGSHRIRIQLTSNDGTVQQDSTEGNFVRNTDRTLLVNARRGNVELDWVGASLPASENGSATRGNWLTRYATTILMSIAGSIVSALTGFAIREIPGYLKSRPTVSSDISQNV